MKKYKYKCVSCNGVSTQDEINQDTADSIGLEIDEIAQIQSGFKEDAEFLCPRCEIWLNGVNFKKVEEYEDKSRFQLDKEYIDVEEFKKQPKGVQEVLKQYHNKYHNVICGKGIPIMAETELRKFIEEKLNGCNIYFESYTNGDKELTIEYECNKSLEGDCDVAEYKVICNDMLDGYWKIACQIATEDI